MAWRTWLATTISLGVAAPGVAQIRVVNFNIAQLNGDSDALGAVLDELSADDHAGFAIPVSVFVFQEVTWETLDFLQARLGGTYTTATYTNSNKDIYGGAQALFYRAAQLNEDPAGHDDIYTGAGRRTDRWRLDLLGYDDPPVGFWVYSSHLKAAAGSKNVAERLFGVQQILANAQQLPTGAHILYMGDYNFSSNSESGYAAFVSEGPVQALDPLGTGSWSGESNAHKHTQSPRATNAGGLSGGGLDDRFDLQLSTAPWQDDDGLSLMSGTYRAVGNDAGHYNLAVNDGTNTYYPGDVPRSDSLADALHDASDHVPVAADYRLPAVLSAFLEPDFGVVIQGAEVSMTLIVENLVPADVADGGAVLDYTGVAAGALAEGVAGSLPALSEPFITTLAVETSVPGSGQGSLTIDSPGESVQHVPMTLSITGTILRPANASFDPSFDEDWRTVGVEMAAGTGVHAIDVPVWNIGWDEAQALLDIDTIAKPDWPFVLTSGPASDIGLDPALLAFTVDTDGLSPDQYVSVIPIQCSDEALPGETTSSVQLVLSLVVTDETTCPEDLNDDGAVAVDDLLAVISAWGPCGGCPEDLDGNGVVAVDDLLAVISAWGPCGD